MNKDFELYHGIVFSKLLHFSRQPIKVEQYPSSDNASYIVNDYIGIYIKYSTKRMSPWHFSFERRHLSEINDMSTRYSQVVILLVCRDDGVAGLTISEYRRIINDAAETREWISVSRKQREKYAVKGSSGKLLNKVGMMDFCEKILEG